MPEHDEQNTPDILTEPQSELTEAEKEQSGLKMPNRTRIGRAAKMFCPQCQSLSIAKQQTPGNDIVTLECGHERQPATLPARPGAVGLEEIHNKKDPNSTIAMQLFTLKTDNGLDGIAEARRQNWG